MSKKSTQIKAVEPVANQETPARRRATNPASLNRAYLSAVNEQFDERDRRAAEGLAEAFALIEEFWAYVPKAAQDPLQEALNEFLSAGGSWIGEPGLLRECLPAIFYKKISDGVS